MAGLIVATAVLIAVLLVALRKVSAEPSQGRSRRGSGAPTDDDAGRDQ